MTINKTFHPGHPQTAPFRRARWRQLMLPGQAAAADGPLDMTMMYVMHHAFRRDLRVLARAARVTPLGDRVAWRELDRRWRLFAYVLHHHHTGEDEGYWPLLAGRVTGAERSVLADMEAEHHLIDPVLEQCAAQFLRLTFDRDQDARQSLVRALDRARSLLEDHLAHEEREAIPLMQRYVTPEEDERIEREHFRAGVPLRQVLEVVPWALHELPPDARDRVLDLTGPVYRGMWLLTRGGFARRDRRAMRHV
jgi:hemerythrin-like domain-containing protein